MFLRPQTVKKKPHLGQENNFKEMCHITRSLERFYESTQCQRGTLKFKASGQSVAKPHRVV